MNKIASGKVRDVYDVDDNLLLVTTDRISAYDVVLNELIPKKGVILNRISEFWFNFTADIMPNHLVSTNSADMPAEFRTPEFEGRSVLVKKLMMLPIECIVRGYISGSGWDAYKETGEICGISLPKGLVESQKLDIPIYTPSTKAGIGHDELISFEETISLVGEENASAIRDKSLEIYQKCAEYAESRGIIIADTKFEFGLDSNGVLTLADEVLTPDSSRFWAVDKYQPGRRQDSFDKQFLRDWLSSSGWNKTPPPPELPQKVIDTTSAKYAEAYEKLTGEKFKI
ncbi:MAG: phosphoribosylaminoimidazolesuccinocarboxamide synthase [Clostridiales bacterium]|jgi:phosphoribosylaminoimidazole-succinocarboxamide synthase|nr:phosphoribosylaminoimidazolesuccinocarboxamide synthase [Clostridiales bacterium]